MAAEALVVSMEEAASLLRVNETQLRDAVKRGDIAAYRDGRNWKIPKSLLISYVENRAITEAKERRKLHEEK